MKWCYYYLWNFIFFCLNSFSIVNQFKSVYLFILFYRMKQSFLHFQICICLLLQYWRNYQHTFQNFLPKLAFSPFQHLMSFHLVKHKNILQFLFFFTDKLILFCYYWTKNFISLTCVIHELILILPLSLQIDELPPWYILLF